MKHGKFKILLNSVNSVRWAQIFGLGLGFVLGCPRFWPWPCKICDFLQRFNELSVNLLQKTINHFTTVPTLKYRRIRGDMIEVFKIITGKYDSLISPHLPLSSM